jgi:hypothetical protein
MKPLTKKFGGGGGEGGLVLSFFSLNKLVYGMINSMYYNCLIPFGYVSTYLHNILWHLSSSPSKE